MMDFNVQVYADPIGHSYHFTFWQNVNDKTYIMRFDNNGETRFDEYKKDDYSTKIPPTFILFKPLATELMEALKRVGVAPKDLSKVEGELIATKYHLEDMRELMKLKREDRKGK